MTKLLSLAAVAFAFLIGICVYSALHDPVSYGPSKSQSRSCTPVDYGHGVHYFPCTAAAFAEALSGFIDKEDVEVTAMTGNGTSAYGLDRGYYVIAR